MFHLWLWYSISGGTKAAKIFRNFLPAKLSFPLTDL